MDDHLQEQSDELEALQSIYPEEFSSIASDGSFTHKIVVVPNQSGGENHVGVSFMFKFPRDYPSVAAEVDIQLDKGLGPKHQDELLQLVHTQASENLGMPAIYVIVEAIRGWLQDNNTAGQDGSMYADMVRRMQQKTVETKKKAEKAAIVAAAEAEESSNLPQVDPEEEERIRKRQCGTAVTVESFAAWKAKFDAEMMALQGGEVSSLPSSDTRPTGKQLFLSNRAGLEEAFIIAAEKDEVMSAEMIEALSGGGKLRADTGAIDVSESLFLEEIDSDGDEDYIGSDDESESEGDDADYDDENG